MGCFAVIPPRSILGLQVRPRAIACKFGVYGDTHIWLVGYRFGRSMALSTRLPSVLPGDHPSTQRHACMIALFGQRMRSSWFHDDKLVDIAIQGLWCSTQAFLAPCIIFVSFRLLARHLFPKN